MKEAQNINRHKPPKKTRADYQREYRFRKKLAKLNPGQSKRTSYLSNDEMPQVSNQHVENLDFDELMQPQDFYDGDDVEHSESAHSFFEDEPLKIENEDDLNMEQERQREYRPRQKKRKAKKSKTPAERQREYRLRRKKLKEAQNINRHKPPKKTRADYQREYRFRKKLAKLNSDQSILTPYLPNEEMRQMSNQHVENLDFDELMQPQDFYDGDDGKHSESAHSFFEDEPLKIENEDDFNMEE